MGEPIGPNLGFDVVRVTEAAAMASARWMGRGNKNNLYKLQRISSLAY